MTQNTCWHPGDQVLVRFIRNRPADLILPVTIVHDDADYIAYFTAVGTPMKGQAMADGTRLTRDIPFIERERLVGGLTDMTWTTNNALVIQQPGRLHATSLFWRESSWEFVGYYGNIQVPLTRTLRGFDSADYLLDVVVSPDLMPAWKDEDEWEDARDHGLLPPDLLADIRREGEQIMVEARDGVWPFDGSLVGWRPDPNWPIPELPADWDAGLF